MDMLNLLQVRSAIAPVVLTDNTVTASAIIDRQGFAALMFAIHFGAFTDLDVTFAVTMHHGDVSNLSDAAAVPATDLSGTLTLAGFQYDSGPGCRKIGYIGAKRYVRLTITPTGNDEVTPAAAAPISAIAVLGEPSISPTANPPP